MQMKRALVALALSTFFLSANAASSGSHVAVKVNGNPLDIVKHLLDDLHKTISYDMGNESLIYTQYAEYCAESKINLTAEVTKLTATRNMLEARMGELNSLIQDCKDQITSMGNMITKNNGDLEREKAEEEARKEEFLKTEAELVQIEGQLTRAINFINFEMNKRRDAAGNTNYDMLFAQINKTRMDNVVNTMSLLLDAIGLSDSSSHRQIMALIQHKAKQQEEDNDLSLDAPERTLYEHKSKPIVQTLQELLKTARDDTRKCRTDNKAALAAFRHFKKRIELLNGRLADKVQRQKQAQTRHEQELAQKTREHNVAVQGLSRAEEALRVSEADCQKKREDHEASVAGFEAELAMIIDALTSLRDNATDAAEGTYSLFQVRQMQEHSKPRTLPSTYSFVQIQENSKQMNQEEEEAKEAKEANTVLAMIQNQAHALRSKALEDAASRVKSVIRYSEKSGKDIFENVRILIRKLVEKLINEREAERDWKQNCSEKFAEIKIELEERKGELDTYQSRLDIKVGQLADAEKSFREATEALRLAQRELDKYDAIRNKQNEEFVKVKYDLENGIQSTNKAMDLLNSYYDRSEGTLTRTVSLVQVRQKDEPAETEEAPEVPENAPEAPPLYSKSSQAGNSIIEILEVINADFEKDLAAKTQIEQNQEQEYTTVTQTLKETKFSQQAIIRFNEGEIPLLTSQVSEYTTDRDSRKTAYESSQESYKLIMEECSIPPESEETVNRKRDMEIDGLKKALAKLKEAQFMQTVDRRLRGSR